MRALVLLSCSLLCSTALFGCELVADFDRSKLVQPQPDAGNSGGVGGSIVIDGGSPDAVIPDDDAGDDDAG